MSDFDHESTINVGDLSEVYAGTDESPSLSLVVSHRRGIEVSTLHEGEELIVGRSSPADMIVPDPSVSRRHALLARRRSAAR